MLLEPSLLARPLIRHWDFSSYLLTGVFILPVHKLWPQILNKGQWRAQIIPSEAKASLSLSPAAQEISSLHCVAGHWPQQARSSIAKPGRFRCWNREGFSATGIDLDNTTGTFYTILKSYIAPACSYRRCCTGTPHLLFSKHHFLMLENWDGRCCAGFPLHLVASPGCVLSCWVFDVHIDCLGAWLCISFEHLTCKKVRAFPGRSYMARPLHLIPFSACVHLPRLYYLYFHPAERGAAFSITNSLSSSLVPPCSGSHTRACIKGKKKKRQNVPTKSNFLAGHFFLFPSIWQEIFMSEQILLPPNQPSFSWICTAVTQFVSLLLRKLPWRHKTQHHD